MQTVSLSGSARQSVGKKGAKSLRRDGRVPAVIYGGSEQTHLHLSEIDLKKIIWSPDTYLLELDIDGTAKSCVIKDYQFHPVTDRIVHLDLLEIFDDKEVAVDLPVRAEGSAVGVVNGGVMITNFRTLSIKGLPSALPDRITLNVSDLKIGDGIRVGEVLIDGCTVLQDANDVVISVKTSRAAMSAATAEEGEEEGEEGAEGAEGAEASAEENSEGGEE
jgi:large subunit ribosomal protein L25